MNIEYKLYVSFSNFLYRDELFKIEIIDTKNFKKGTLEFYGIQVQRSVLYTH